MHWDAQAQLRWRFELRRVLPAPEPMPREAYFDAPRRLPCGVQALCFAEGSLRWRAWMRRVAEENAR